ncbi:Phage protein U [Hartmannibacter diazotrophicus]|uniref:Phage protein U n=1 Tax=Hartmannibacter diazotrophicus TaxID=1482074 RepID=A0A2C9D712_9HYPH|nr:phage tail protein [Hartmannibacter diazotrophicus]SON55541.1 Phage protein U [Hartmannibacter diazotrophicus]
MLYILGALVFDTRPFNADSFERSSSADIVAKGTMGGLQTHEFMGEGDEEITLTGRLLPFRTGGLTELEIAREMSRQGTQMPLMRGDGLRLGWYAINALDERHDDLMRGGVGFTVDYRLRLVKTGNSAAISEAGLIVGLLNLFGVI